MAQQINKNMWYLIIGFFLVLLQLCYLVNFPVNIFPEIFFYPWLVSKGLLPYRDFFDHHGFLLYYLLSPFITSNLSFLNAVFITIQIINLFIFQLILKKVTNKVGYLIVGLLFLIGNNFLTKNLFWYENIIVTIYLLIYLIILLRIKHKEIFIGALITTATFIKPNAAIIIIPLIYYFRNIKTLVPFVIAWILLIAYFYYHNGLHQLISYLLLFNRSLPGNLTLKMNFAGDTNFLIISLFWFLLLLFLFFLGKKNMQKNYFIPLSFALFSFIFLLILYSRIHLLPIFTFTCLLTGILFNNLQTFYLKILKITTITYIFFVSYLFIKEIVLQPDEKSYITGHPNISIVKYIKNNYSTLKPFYIMANAPEYYFFSNQLPPTKMPVILYSIYKNYFKNLDNELIHDLESNRINTIIQPLPCDINYCSNYGLQKYIKTKFGLIFKTNSVKIYQRLTENNQL